VNAIQRSYVLLHLAILFWSFTAILGDLIQLAALPLVWWRVALTSIILLFWPRLITALKSVSRADVLRYVGIGVLVALHWLCFYGSIKLANASVALVTLATTTLFTAFIEPVVFGASLALIDIILGLLIVPAMYLVTSDFEGDMSIGFWLGIMSALLIALFGVLNRKWIRKAPAHVITFSAFIFITLLGLVSFLAGYGFDVALHSLDYVYMLVLVIVCTIAPFILHLKALRHISAYASNLLINLEPIYGIALAALILNEHQELDTRFYIGVGMIIVTIMIYPILKNLKEDNVF